MAYRVGRENESGAGNNSVELVSVATALHWLDLTLFYAEVRRVLVPGGILAAWGYGYPSVTPEIDVAIAWFGTQRMSVYWPPERRHLETGFRDLPFPFEEVVFGERSMTVGMTREQFIGYVDTWSSVAVARRRELSDPIAEFRDRLLPFWNDEQQRDVTGPLYARIGRWRP